MKYLLALLLVLTVASAQAQLKTGALTTNTAPITIAANSTNLLASTHNMIALKAGSYLTLHALIGGTNASTAGTLSVFYALSVDGTNFGTQNPALTQVITHDSGTGVRAGITFSPLQLAGARLFRAYAVLNTNPAPFYLTNILFGHRFD